MLKRIFGVFAMAAVAFSLCGCELFLEAMDVENAANAEDPTSDNYQARFVVGVFAIV